MPHYNKLDKAELKELFAGLNAQYKEFQAKNLKLDMSRGKPEKGQLDISEKLMETLNIDDFSAENGEDCRNYGSLDGIPEAKRFMADIMEVAPENVFVGGNSSLNLMYNCVNFAFVHGMPESERPWCKEEKIKFLCPSPGYDRHFAITEQFGFELVTIPMTAEGPDMDAVEEAVKDPSVKGIWCVPKYSNPQGITYSDDTVRRFAALAPAAKDFRIFWDNAYAVHALDVDNLDPLLNVMAEAEKLGNEDILFIFSSTSKITFPGSGISATGMSAKNLKWFFGHTFFQTVCHDKVNQLRHAHMLPDFSCVLEHMKKHADILRPKFDIVLNALTPLGEEGIAEWTVPKGGYFVSVDVPAGCAKRTVQLCKEAGVVLTSAGATYPYGKEPEDKNVRIAPTFPPISELKQAMELFCLCVRLASVEKLLG